MSQPEFETGELQLPQVFENDGMTGEPYKPPFHVADTGYKERQQREDAAKEVTERIGKIITEQSTKD